MRTVNALAGFAIALWVGLAWIGVGLIRGVVAQHVSGYPSSGQIFFCIGVPSTSVVLLTLSVFAFNFLMRSPLFLAQAN
jgi:hypothetical protein